MDCLFRIRIDGFKLETYRILSGFCRLVFLKFRLLNQFTCCSNSDFLMPFKLLNHFLDSNRKTVTSTLEIPQLNTVQKRLLIRI